MDVYPGAEELCIHYLPENQWASIKQNRVLACSPNAGKYLGYSSGMVRIPAGAFEELPIVGGG